MSGIDSKQAIAYLDPFQEPEPSQESGLNSRYRSTFAPNPDQESSSAHQRNTSSSSNPFRDHGKTPAKSGASTSARPLSQGSPHRQFPKYREEAFGNAPPSYDVATSPGHSRNNSRQHRRNSSLTERFPGDNSHKPLDVIRRDSKRATRSPHIQKRHLPRPDTVDQLDPAFGGISYHHEGPFDAALLVRNTSYQSSPVAALQTSTAEALKATPAENVKDALERHVPLDGVAVVPPGVPDRFGRTYNYEEGTDLMQEEYDGPGYKKWNGLDYDSEDLKGKSEPAFGLDRALRAHKIDDEGIEMEDRAGIDRDYHRAQRNGTLDRRDPVDIAGGESRYVDLEVKNTAASSSGNRHSIAGSLKKRIGSLRKKHDD